jgi:hypothetical protein
MSENNDPRPEVPETAEATETPEAEAPAKRRFRDRFAGSGERLRGTRGLIAATLAALIVGGLGGAAIHAAVDGDRHEHGFGHHFGERPGPPRDFDRRAPGGIPGQLPPTTTPEDEESSPSPTPSESASESSNS